MPRLFIALSMPDEVAADLDRLCTALPDIRWTGPDAFHLTLRFIGEVDHAIFYEIGENLAQIRAAPFDLRLKGVGVFPPRGLPHTLWAGVDDPAPLVDLRRRIERVMREAGLEGERRNFVPHVTLGRIGAALPEARFATWLSRRSLFTSERFPVSTFHLFSSHLRPEGAEHVVEATYDFVTGFMDRA